MISMSKQNARIRQHLSASCQEVRTKNRFRFGNCEIKIDHNSPVNAVEYPEFVTVSIWNPETGVDMRFFVPVENVEFIENAL